MDSSSVIISMTLLQYTSTLGWVLTCCFQSCAFCLLLGIFTFGFHMTLYLRLPIFYLLVEYGAYLHCHFKPVFSFRVPGTFDWTCTQKINICLWSAMASFEKFVTNIRKWTFLWASCVPRMCSFPCMGLGVCICSIVIRPHIDGTTTADDSSSVMRAMSFAAWIVVCSFCSLVGPLHDNIFITLATVPPPSIVTGAKCSSSILRSMGNISRMCLSIYIIPIYTSPARFEGCLISHEPADVPRERRVRFQPEYWSAVFCRLIQMIGDG